MSRLDVWLTRTVVEVGTSRRKTSVPASTRSTENTTRLPSPLSFGPKASPRNDPPEALRLTRVVVPDATSRR